MGEEQSALVYPLFSGADHWLSTSISTEDRTDKVYTQSNMVNSVLGPVSVPRSKAFHCLLVYGNEAIECFLSTIYSFHLLNIDPNFGQSLKCCICDFGGDRKCTQVI